MRDDTLALREASRTPSDEQRISKWIAAGLPIATVVVAAIVGVLVGPATSILVLAAGLLLGVIALLWGSLRILSGEASLPPELEALDMATQGVDALASRKKMLLRALKDLQNERAIGKIEDEDYEQLAAAHREELKTVLRQIDESLAPHRSRAEEAARAHLASVGLTPTEGGGATPAKLARGSDSSHGDATDTTNETSASRVTCPECDASNERDAKFCKECATKLPSRSQGQTPAASSGNDDTKDSADA
jgi:hypothetical protein